MTRLVSHSLHRPRLANSLECLQTRGVPGVTGVLVTTTRHWSRLTAAKLGAGAFSVCREAASSYLQGSSILQDIEKPQSSPADTAVAHCHHPGSILTLQPEEATPAGGHHLASFLHPPPDLLNPVQSAPGRSNQVFLCCAKPRSPWVCGPSYPALDVYVSGYIL